jgi:hypothetical protein
MGPADRLPGEVRAKTMNGVDTALSKDMASRPCNAHMTVVAEGSPFPCNNSTSNRQRTPNTLEEPRKSNTSEPQLLRKSSFLIDGNQRQALGTPTEAVKGNGSSQSLHAISMHL